MYQQHNWARSSAELTNLLVLLCLPLWTKLVVEDWASFCRSRLLNFVANLSDDNVRTASRKAFAALPNLKEAIAHLSTLKGVGPATASAVLAAHTPSIVPFMSDEVYIFVNL
jgi:hypothetical protein